VSRFRSGNKLNALARREATDSFIDQIKKGLTANHFSTATHLTQPLQKYLPNSNLQFPRQTEFGLNCVHWEFLRAVILSYDLSIEAYFEISSRTHDRSSGSLDIFLFGNKVLILLESKGFRGIKMIRGSFGALKSEPGNEG